MSHCRLLWGVWLVVLTAGLAPAATPDTQPVDGLRENTPHVHALTNVRIIVAPGQVIEHGTLVFRDGVIEAAGDAPPPADARVWNLEGKSVYPGFIDAYGEVSLGPDTSESGAPYWNSLVSPQRDVAEHYASDDDLNKKLRGQGITARLIAPADGIIKGTSALVLTGDEENRQAIIKGRVAQHLRLTVPRSRGRESYPSSPMGAVALARQAFYDAAWYEQAWAAYEANASLPRPERNDALDALRRESAANYLVIADASNELFALRADRFAREFTLNVVLRGSGHEYKRLAAIQQTARAVIVPLNFPKPPNVASVESALNVELDQLLHWDLAPENAQRLDQAGVRIAFTSHGLPDQAKFLEAIRQVVQRGLSPEAALRALTITPAAMFGMSERLGTLERGKTANVVVASGDLFDKETKIVATWINGRRYEVASEPMRDVRGEWKIEAQGVLPALLFKLTGQPDKLSGELVASQSETEKEEIKLDRLGFQEGRFSCTFEAEKVLTKGVARLTAVASFPTEGEPTWLGQITFADGRQVTFTARRVARFDPQAKDSGKDEDKDQKEDKKEEAAEEKPPAKASFAVNYPLGSFGRAAPPEQPAAVVFQNATVWTCGKAGVLENASVLIVDGQVVAVGTSVKLPDNAVVIDAAGKHITPGIIDCHSHMATDGGINEGTQAITAEVRIGDFIDCDDISIYQQLAGGVTTANILHGSANPIGGQNQVIKLRWGALPEEMKFADAPAGIKFALGENVKQSNWGDNYSSRYPQTRMGVEQIMRDAFEAARNYRATWRNWEQTRPGLPPRRDLELEALAEVVEGSRWIHCHSYRQDEILALLRTLEDFHIRVGSLQHILEGYKVADAMAKHGATGSAFSDWWAYKLEVYDAIPYAGALMHNAGVVVSFNSDDQELARHLNHEAAKAVKYGGVSPEETLKFVTLNPAKQLRIDKLVGSLERGKQADLVVWSGSPLSVFSRCEQTWIDGRKYFDVTEDQQLRAEADRMRNELVQKILDSGESMKKDDEGDEDESELWPREDIFCHRHAH